MNRFGKLPSKQQDDSIATTSYETEKHLQSTMGLAKEKGGLSEQKRTQIVSATHVNVFLYATSFWIQLGVLPYLSKSLGADPVIFGYLQTTFAIVQLCGGPFFGRFGDLFGCKAALALAFSASSIAYGLLATATSVPMLFISRFPSVAMHSMQGSQMVITDITANEFRAASLGKLGISYGLGMIVGPFLGGIITSNYNKQLAAATATAGSIVSIVIVLMFIPVNTKTNISTSEDNSDTSQTGKSEEKESVFNAARILATLKVPNVAYLLAIKCICGIPFGIFQSMFSIVTMEYFKLGPKENGFILSYVGVMGILVQGLGVGFLTRRYKDTTLLSISVVAISLSYLLMVPVADVYTFCVVLTPLIMGGAIFQVVVTSCITKMVSCQETGAALGLSMATHALIRSISPTIGGLLFSHFGFAIFGIVGFVINGPLSLYLVIYGRKEF
eukprot:gene11987-13225_t